MKRLFLVVSLMTATMSVSACAITLQTVRIGAEWAGSKFQFATRCDSVSITGFSCLQFPNGGKIHAFSFQSSQKFNSELLLLLLISPGRDESNRHEIIATHHVPNMGPQNIQRDLSLPYPIVIPPGWYVWVKGEGQLEPTSTVEVQITLFMEAPVNVVTILNH